jgi:hypothetical protein
MYLSSQAHRRLRLDQMAQRGEAFEARSLDPLVASLGLSLKF